MVFIMDFKVSSKEWALAAIFAVAGYLLTMREVIMRLNSLDPIAGVAVFYAILYITLAVLSHFGLVIWKFRIDTPMKTLGLLLITFAFFIIVNWESCYVNTVASGSCSGVSSVYFASEDGAVWYLWTHVAEIADVEIARILTFSVTPFVLAVVGGALVSGGIKVM